MIQRHFYCFKLVVLIALLQFLKKRQITFFASNQLRHCVCGNWFQALVACVLKLILHCTHSDHEADSFLMLSSYISNMLAQPTDQRIIKDASPSGYIVYLIETKKLRFLKLYVILRLFHTFIYHQNDTQ